MKAKALITHDPETFRIEEVILPELNPDQVLIRTQFSGVSIGTEFALIWGKIHWGPYPLCTGYMGTGLIEQVGGDVHRFKPGDAVYFRGCDAMTLEDGRKVSPVSGAHASRVVLRPDTHHGVDPILRGADMETASLFVMPAVGLYGVDMANPRMGQTVVIHGCGLIGLAALAACVHRGCRVIAVDLHERPLRLAEEFGADVVLNGASQDVASELRKTAPEGADVVFECTGLPECLNPAILLCRPLGTFVWQGNYGEAPVSLDFLQAHTRRLTMVFPCDDGWEPCRRAVIKNMALGALKWEKVMTHRIRWPEAPTLFGRILQGDPDIIGVTIDWRGVDG